MQNTNQCLCVSARARARVGPEMQCRICAHLDIGNQVNSTQISKIGEEGYADLAMHVQLCIHCWLTRFFLHSGYYPYTTRVLGGRHWLRVTGPYL